jgi:hypothetical protein
MFAKGNQFGRGRPKISLNKPELLLPIIFQKAHINWANDFMAVYRAHKENPKDPFLKEKVDFFLALMPYLCTKIAIKDLEASKFTTEADSKAMSNQTKALIEALEDVNAKPASPSPKTSVANRPSEIPPKS